MAPWKLQSWAHRQRVAFAFSVYFVLYSSLIQITRPGGKTLLATVVVLGWVIPPDFRNATLVTVGESAVWAVQFMFFTLENQTIPSGFCCFRNHLQTLTFFLSFSLSFSFLFHFSFLFFSLPFSLLTSLSSPPSLFFLSLSLPSSLHPNPFPIPSPSRPLTAPVQSLPNPYSSPPPPHPFPPFLPVSFSLLLSYFNIWVF